MSRNKNFFLFPILQLYFNLIFSCYVNCINYILLLGLSFKYYIIVNNRYSVIEHNETTSTYFRIQTNNSIFLCLNFKLILQTI